MSQEDFQGLRRGRHVLLRGVALCDIRVCEVVIFKVSSEVVVLFRLALCDIGRVSEGACVCMTVMGLELPCLWGKPNLHSTLYTPHYTLRALHPTLYSQNSTIYTPHSTLDSLHSTLYTAHFTLHTLHFRLDTPHFTLYTLHLI